MNKIIDGSNMSSQKKDIIKIFGTLELSHNNNSGSEQTTDQTYKDPTKKREINK